MIGWFRVKDSAFGETDDGVSLTVAGEVVGEDITTFHRKSPHPDGSPMWVCRIEASSDVITRLTDDPRVKELDSLPVQALENISSAASGRTKQDWESAFR